MTTTSVMMGADAPAASIDFEGRKISVRKLTRELQARFSRDLIERVRREALTIYRDQPDLLRAELKQLHEDAVSGVYEFWEEFVQGKEVCRPEERGGVAGHVTGREGGYLRTVNGALALWGLLLDCDQEQLERLCEQRREEVEHLIGLAVAESVGGARDGWKPGEPPKNQPGARGRTPPAPAPTASASAAPATPN